MSQIGHNKWPKMDEWFELIEIKAWSRIHIFIMDYMQRVSGWVFQILIPTHYIKEWWKTSFQYSPDSIAHFALVDWKYKVTGITTCIPEWYYLKAA